MPTVLPLAFLAVQLLIFALLPSMSSAAAYVAMVLAPLFAALACGLRAWREGPSTRIGWSLLALTCVVWAFGALGNLWHELILGLAGQMYRSAMLAFNLAVVPVAFLIASDRWGEAPRAVRVVDGALAFALCHAFFLNTWTLLTERTGPGEDGFASMVWQYDLQTLLLAAGTLVRWHVCEDRAERSLFRALAVYQCSYLVVAVANNHWIAQWPEGSTEGGSVVTVVFALVAALALQPAVQALPLTPSRAWARAVRSARPFMLPGALLIVALTLIRVDYVSGAVAVAVAVIGYGLRNALAEVGHLERGETLQRERTELQNIALTDALTGVPNRRYLDQALRDAVQRERVSGAPLAVLMIDIDHFKQLNDRSGHAAGDDCLREVAAALAQALQRPGDVLARYGGEEFVALLHGADAAGAQVVGERLRAAVESRRIAHPGAAMGIVTVSVGVASERIVDPVGAARLVEAADRSLYDAKCTGRNRLGLALAGAA